MPKASCAACEAITSYLEGYVGRRVYGVIRSFYEIRKRKRKKTHTVTMVFKTEAGDRARDIRVEDVPPFLLLREFESPSILDGELPRPIVLKPNGWLWYSEEVKAKADCLRQPGDLSWTVPFDFKEKIYARFLAKIAHCMAIARFGPNSFKPFLPPLIVGKESNLGWLIGGGWPPNEVGPILPKGRHTIVGHEMALGLMKNGATGHTLLFIDIRLFIFTGSPGYRVVIGEPGPRIIEELT